MKALRLLVLCSFVPTLALADEVADVTARIQSEVVKPLTSTGRKVSKFSRVARPPTSFTAKLVSKTPSTDADGKTFYSFAVDRRDWNYDFDEDVAKKEAPKPAYTGCAYVNGDVYVKQGDTFRPAAILAGKRVSPVANVCVSREVANVL